jgi:hypothetical protein
MRCSPKSVAGEILERRRRSGSSGADQARIDRPNGRITPMAPGITPAQALVHEPIQADKKWLGAMDWL